MVRISIAIRMATVGAVCVTAAIANAQQAPPPPLIDFVTQEESATQLQQSTGIAVQRLCAGLVAEGGLSLDPDTAEGDAFLRCNELVETAAGLLGRQPATNRSLGLESDELLAALQQFSGEETHSQGTLATRVTNGQFANIAGRLNSLRLATSGLAGGVGVAYSDPSGAYPGSAADQFNDWTISRGNVRGGGAAADLAGSRVGWFLEGSFNTGDRDATANEDGFDFDATSFTVGLDYQTDSGVLGVSVGMDNHEADFDQSGLVVAGGKTEVESVTGALFGAWYLGSVYLDAIVSYGDVDSDVERRLLYDSNNPDPDMCNCPGEDRRLIGSTSGDHLTGGVTIGYDAPLGNWEVSTTLSANYRDIDIDGYDEVDLEANSGLALRYASQSIESFRSILGISVDRRISRDFGVVIPQFRAEWHHEFEDDPQTILAKFVVEDEIAAGSDPLDFVSAGCLSCMRLTADEVDTDFGLVGVGVSFVLTNRLQLYGAYDTLIGLSDLTSHSVSLGLRGQF